jgi:hypothetical protein
MKKLLMIMVVHLPIILATTNATAQDKFIAYNKQTAGLVAVADRSLKTSAIQPVGINEHVSKKFAKQFSSATNAVWTTSANGFEVQFTTNGIIHWVFLTKKGNYRSLMRYYTEKDLPAYIRHQVKSMYYDFSIISVKEVNHDHITAYLVTIADEKIWKVIRVIDGDTDVWEEHVKG